MANTTKAGRTTTSPEIHYRLPGVDTTRSSEQHYQEALFRTSEIGSDWVAFADPSVSHPDALETGWHLSTKRVPAQELVRSTINELRESGKYKNLIFFGSSAGGFGALNHSYQVPGSIAVVMNPVIEIRQEAKRYWDEFCASAYVGWSSEKIEKKLTISMSEVYAGKMKNRIVYIQNLQDEHYFNKHYSSFVNEVSDKSRVLTYCGNWGRGHVVPPRWVYTQALRQVVESAGEWNRLFTLKVTNLE
ncbi:hypothetical protein KRR55_16560 [Paeniglutamicibacter sp. ABSL32-1]|uniref:hypothetical protein n=1 Tax=Paeniglutamicibacter quisquiliarum TaxID=2849498 RepID=UPI001C2D6969|nr:hypothetical protein [Paeniglutamicibacter quisquiliarum]MBV1780729.1 hypothetical protein [Paeniglutamicibacter quisquiliarum]